MRGVREIWSWHVSEYLKGLAWRTDTQTDRHATALSLYTQAARFCRSLIELIRSLDTWQQNSLEAALSRTDTHRHRQGDTQTDKDRDRERQNSAMRNVLAQYSSTRDPRGLSHAVDKRNSFCIQTSHPVAVAHPHVQYVCKKMKTDRHFSTQVIIDMSKGRRDPTRPNYLNGWLWNMAE